VTCISKKIEDGVDISFLSIKIFVEVSKIRKNGKRVLYIVLKVLSNEKIKIYNAIPFNIL
jgi:hypothetical protein